METIKECVLCKGKIEGYGHNPNPLSKTGNCCDECNTTKVIPERIKLVKERK